MLANELGMIHKVKVRVIPHVLTWDGIRLNITIHMQALLGVARNIRTYIPYIVMK